MELRLEQAKAGARTVFFVDAVHFVLGAYLGWLWCFARVLVRAPSGRQRFNVLGALHAISHQLITVTNESYITASCVCELLDKIAALGLGLPITVVMDMHGINAVGSCSRRPESWTWNCCFCHLTRLISI